ncbi:hypothetical protein NL526_28175, partial [Klebsiella pneumoniae]|nr:hypothetical protein [Klebsiella pneumoniae]
TLDDWYQKLSFDVFQKNYGSGLLQVYQQSPFTALLAAYPEHKWIPWKFDTLPRGFWKDEKNVRLYFDWLGSKLGVNHLDDWYQNLSWD